MWTDCVVFTAEVTLKTNEERKKIVRVSREGVTCIEGQEKEKSVRFLANVAQVVRILHPSKLQAEKDTLVFVVLLCLGAGVQRGD